ncbi:MAG: hypothetical protein V1918_00090 [Planctomycetota bacterium]
MARRPSGAELVEGAEGTEGAKARLKVILETIARMKSIAEACADLGMGEAGFHKLRTRVIQEAVAGLEPRKPGRKPKERSAEAARIVDLEAEVARLERELKASRIREEIAVTMPHVLGRKKKRERSRRRS